MYLLYLLQLAPMCHTITRPWVCIARCATVAALSLCLCCHPTFKPPVATFLLLRLTVSGLS